MFLVVFGAIKLLLTLLAQKRDGFVFMFDLEKCRKQITKDRNMKERDDGEVSISINDECQQDDMFVTKSRTI